MVMGKDCGWFRWVDDSLSRHYKGEINLLMRDLEEARIVSLEIPILKDIIKEEKQKAKADLDASVARVVDLEEALKLEKKKSYDRGVLIAVLVVMLVVCCLYMCW